MMYIEQYPITQEGLDYVVGLSREQRHQVMHKLLRARETDKLQSFCACWLRVIKTSGVPDHKTYHADVEAMAKEVGLL